MENCSTLLRTKCKLWCNTLCVWTEMYDMYIDVISYIRTGVIYLILHIYSAVLFLRVHESLLISFHSQFKQIPFDQIWENEFRENNQVETWNLPNVFYIHLCNSFLWYLMG